MSPALVSRRRVLWHGCLLLLSAGLIHAADEPAKEPAPEKILPWTAGGKNHGPRARQDNVAVGGEMSWLCSKMWSFYEGRITSFRPGKDKPDKGEEVYWTGKNSEVGTTSNRRVWVIELAESSQKKERAPALMFLMDEQGRVGGVPGDLSLFFFLAGAKGDQLTYVFDEGKEDVGHLTVKRKPAGKGATQSYEFKFEEGVPKFLESVKVVKKK